MTIRSTLLGVVLALGSTTLFAAGNGDALMRAVRDGDTAAVRALIQQRADVNAAHADGTTPLHWAAKRGDVAAAAALLKAGANPNAVNRYGVSALSLAARAGSASMLTTLFEGRADLRQAEAALPDGQRLLMLAASTGQIDALKVLLAHGAEVNATEPRTGTTAVMWAAIANRADAIRLLAEAGADVDARSKLTAYPHTPPAVVGDPLEPGVSYVGQTVLPKGGWTPLMYAAREGAVDAARALVSARAGLDERDPDGTPALTFAIINGHYDVASLLIDAGANLDLADNAGMTPLYAAVDMHTLASTFGRPDLTPAAVAGSVDVVRALLTHGANPNATLSGRVLKRVHNPGDAKLDQGATAFMRAARAGDVVMMRLLLDAGADPALVQKNGNTPIILAAGLGAERGSNNPLRGSEADAIAAIELCLERGVDVNAVNAAGDTAVHVALGSPAIVRLLAARGARLDVKNKQSRTPLDAALRAREPQDETIALLRELLGRP